jgi:hypothetical protein
MVEYGEEELGVEREKDKADSLFLYLFGNNKLKMFFMLASSTLEEILHRSLISNTPFY